MSEFLYLNKVFVDLKSKTVTRKIRIGDIGDIGSRKSTASYTIKLARTTRTVKMLDMIGVSGNTSRKPFELITADYIVNGIPLVSNGYAKIKSTSKYIEINIFDGIKGLSELLKGKKIADLPLDDLNHILTSQEYIDSYSNTEGFIYGIADYGLGKAVSLKVEKQAPSIFQHTIFRKIFESNGLNLIGDFFTTNTKYLNEVITPSRGYEIEDSAFVSTAKGGADTNIISYFNLSPTPVSYIEKFVFTDLGLVGASVVSGDIVFSVAGLYKLNLTSSYTVAVNNSVWINVKVNGTTKATISLEVGDTLTKISDIVLTIAASDIISLEVNCNVYQADESGKYIADFSASCDGLLYLQEGGQLITASDYIGDMYQIDFVKDVLRRYALISHPITNTSEYEFTLINDILEDTENAEDWTLKLKGELDENYISGYARINTAKYNYPEEIVIPNNDGEMLIDNENAELEKTLFDSVFEIPNTSGAMSNEIIYLIPIWELKDAVVENRETPLKVMEIKRITTNITAKLFDEVTGVSASSNIPFLNLENMSMEYYLTTFYPNFKKMINDYKEVEGEFKLSVIDIYNLNFFRLKFLKQTGQFYYLDTVINTPEKLSKVKMIEIK